MTNYNIRIGDIRRHPKGHLETVNALPLVGHSVQMSTGTHLRWLTQAWVDKNMPLVDRAGVRVGDGRRDGLETFRVLWIDHDYATCETSEGRKSLSLDYLARCVLVERDGENVTAENKPTGAT